MYKLCFSICLFLFYSVNAQNWQSLASYNSDSRHHPITFSNDRFGFVFAGQNDLGEYLADGHRFDTQTQTWEQVANFEGGPRGYAYGVSNNTTAYVGFGRYNSDYPTDWWSYDIQNDQWVQLADFPSAGRSHPALVLVNDKVFVGCGSNTTNLGDWWEYDISNDTWTQKADFPGNDRHHPYYFSIGDYAYVGFGHGSSPGPGSNPSSNSYIYNDIYRYNPGNDSWVQLANFPSEARVAGTQFSYNGKGYLLSGDGDNHGPLDSGELWEYNPETDNWLQLDSHPGNARWAPGCFVINCDLYFTSGFDRINEIYFNDLISFELGQQCGCTDSNAFNFNSISSINDNSCCYIEGCTDPYSLNYNSEACYDDGSCQISVLGCDNPLSSNYNPESNTLIANGGPLDIYEYGLGGFHYNDSYDMVFDCIEDVEIMSIDVYSEISFIVTIEILDSNNNQIYNNSFDLIEGLNTLNLNFSLLVGDNYKIGVNGDNFGLYRNNNIESNIFPINILDHIVITTNTTSDPQDYFYYFYNWKLSTECDELEPTWDCNNDYACVELSDGSGNFQSLEECESVCNIVIADSWNCINDACVDPMDGSGKFSTLNDCEHVCQNISSISEKMTDVNIFPNPSSNIFNIQFNSDSETEIFVTNILGEQVYFESTKSIGEFNTQIDLSNYSKGVYNLRIKLFEMIINRQLILY